MGPEIWASGPEIAISLQGTDLSTAALSAVGIVDTGASCVCLDQSIPLQLGLQAIDRTQMQVADGTWVPALGFMIRLTIPELKVDDWIKAFGVKMRYPSSRVLLGRSFLSDYHVTYNGPDQTFHWFRAAPPIYEDLDG